jgi:5-methylcytosine-specific restriction endonuclease McrA
MDNKEQAYMKAYYQAHKDYLRKRQKERYHANPEKANLYYLANKEYIRKRKKEYRIMNFEKLNNLNKKWKKEHIEDVKLYHATYLKNNPEKNALYCRKRKALKLGVEHESYLGVHIFERDSWTCQICGRKINKRLKWPNPHSKSIDHIIPLSKGGDDRPLNVQAAHLRCNLGKSIKSVGQLMLFGQECLFKEKK